MIQEKSQADRKIKSSRFHSFRKRIPSIRDTRESLRRIANSIRRGSIASRNVSLQYVIREKALGGRKNQVVETPSLQETYLFNTWYRKRLRQTEESLGLHPIAWGKWVISLSRAKSLRQIEESRWKNQFAWGNFAFPVKNINLPKAIRNFQCDSSICLKQFHLASVIRPLA